MQNFNNNAENNTYMWEYEKCHTYDKITLGEVTIREGRLILILKNVYGTFETVAHDVCIHDDVCIPT